jgi:hypothetical protein
MLSFLLDENISHQIAFQLQEKRPEIPIISVHHWQTGRFLQASDREILFAAFPEKLSLVTYDVETIPPLLVHLYEEGYAHAGVILVQHRTLPSHDFGGLIRALTQLWEKTGQEEWANRMVFLQGL